jgi:heme/copper-type cytochrome/quinol oxidase subunit 2
MIRIFFAAMTALLLTASPALATHSHPWQLWFQEAASPSAEHIQFLYTFVLWIVVAITVFVMFLLLYVMVRFNKRANPVPSQTSHNVLIEIIWTVVPVLILIVIASLRSVCFIHRPHAQSGNDPESHRLPMVLGLRIPGQRRRQFPVLHGS